MAGIMSDPCLPSLTRLLPLAWPIECSRFQARRVPCNVADTLSCFLGLRRYQQQHGHQRLGSRVARPRSERLGRPFRPDDPWRKLVSGKLSLKPRPVSPLR